MNMISSKELYNAYKQKGFTDRTQELVNFALLLEKQAYDIGYEDGKNLSERKYEISTR